MNVAATGSSIYEKFCSPICAANALDQGNIESAVEMFRNMPDRDVISWTSLVAGYAQNDAHDKAIKLFCQMRDAGIYSDQFIIQHFECCAELTLLEFGQQIHATSSSMAFKHRYQ